MRTATMWLALQTVMVIGVRGQAVQGDLLAAALQNPGDEEIVDQIPSAYHDATDPAVLVRLRELFQKVTHKQLRRPLAILMWVTLGQRDDLYFNVLAAYAQESATSNAPLPEFFDSEGNPIKQSEPPVAFTNWCEAHLLNPGTCWSTVLEQAPDVYFLALLKERRAIPIFRQGLESNNHAVVEMSVLGLGFLNDASSLPLIESAVHRFRPKQQALIASQLAQFDDPRVAPLLDEFVKDPVWRKQLDEDIRKRHADGVKQ